MPTADIGGAIPWVETGTITAVYPQRGAVDWQSDSNDRQFFNIQVLAPVFNHQQGEGVSVLPQVGAKAVVMSLSDGHEPVVAGFLSPPQDQNTDDQDADYSGGRAPDLREALWVVGSRHGGRLGLFRDGTAVISGGPGAASFYLPVGKLVTAAIEAQGRLGSFSWDAVVADDHVETRAVFSTGMETRGTLLVRLGGLGAGGTQGIAGGQPVLHLVVSPQGIDHQDGHVVGTQVFEFQLDDDGSIRARSATSEFKLDQGGNFTYRLAGNLQGTHLGNVALTGQSLTATLAGQLALSAAGVSISAASVLSLQAPVVTVGPAPFVPAVNYYGLAQWLSKYVIPTCADPGGASGDLLTLQSQTVKISP